MVDSGRDRDPRTLLRRPAVLLTIAVVSLAVIAGGLAWQVGQRQPAEATGPSARPTGTAGSQAPWVSLAPSPSTTPSDDGPATAVLEASAAMGGVVPVDAEFRLTSTGPTPAADLAARLTTRPELMFTVAPGSDAQVVGLRPAQPLLPGVVYRFELAGPTGELLDTWAFQASQPVRVIGTVPGDESEDVPTDTGIEITFDQDGVVDAASHITVSPKTAGRFEEHGRTTVFIPDRPLKPATLYSVVVSPGVAVPGTGEASAVATRFQFETAAKGDASRADRFEFQDDVFESPTAERPVIGLWWYGDTESPPKRIHLEAYRLPDLDAAVAAFRSLRTQPDWASWSTEGLVDTAPLRRVVNVNAPLQPFENASFVRLPKALPAGWYLLQHEDGSRPIQAILQVTDLAGYMAVSTTRTVVWANDLDGGGAVTGATVLGNETRMGATDTDGLLLATTPSTLLPDPTRSCDRPCDPIITITARDGRAVFLPVASTHDKLDSYDGAYWWSESDPDFWSLLHPDRIWYRSDDTVNVWGVVRGRDDDAVPSAATLRIVAQGDGDVVHAPLITRTVKPGATGVFTTAIPLVGVAEGYYMIELTLGDTVIRSSTFIVRPIVKPAYQLQVTTGHHVYIAGDRIKITATATFYEGSPVPGVPLRIQGIVERDVTTDDTGTAIYRTTAVPDPDEEGPTYNVFEVVPARAEEGEIAGAAREIGIYPSSRWIDAESQIKNGRVVVTGGVHLVDVDRLETEIKGGRSVWEVDPRGAAVKGANVRVRFIEQIPIRTQIGTEYDFIEKRVVPLYEYEMRQRDAGTVRVKTAADGSYKASIKATEAAHDYQVKVSVNDPDNHVARSTTYAEHDPWPLNDRPEAVLQTTDPGTDIHDYGVGDRMDLTMTDPGTKQAAGDGTRYLFYVAQRGIRSAKVQSSPRFITTYQRWAVPDLLVSAVRFTDHGYVGTASFDAWFRASDRALRVDLDVRAARYAPGETATVDIRTTGGSGAPVAATVVVRAVDERLFAMGAASDDDPLAELYQPVGSMIVASRASHRTPRSQFEGGDTTGGGDDGRDEFRDFVLFQSIETGADGRGAVTFRLPDDLTSWHVSASALSADLETGFGSVLVPVGLPFFVDATIAPEYLVADRPSLPIRVYGSAVTAGDPVTIRVTSATLGLDSGPIASTAFATATVPLPALKPGRHTVTITATTGTGSAKRTDTLVRTLSLVETRLTVSRTASVELPTTGPLQGGDGLTTVVISDASAGRYLGLLDDLAAGGGARLERGLAAELAQAILLREFGSIYAGADVGTFMAARYQTVDGGLAVLPYASSDLETSAMVAIVAPDSVERSSLRAYLNDVRSARDTSREGRMFALAGLAGLGEAVLPAIRTAAADPALTIREQLMVALGAAALGDSDTARTLATTLMDEYGEAAADQARLRVGSSAADVTWATAHMAVLAAAIGDPLAASFWAYVETNPAADQLQSLPAIGYVQAVLERAPVTPATFAYTVKGVRTVASLEDARSFGLTLSAAELATLTVEPLTGTIGVTTAWQEAVAAASLRPDPDVRIARTVKPAGTVKGSDLVTVTLTATFGAQAATECYQVTELVPSGLTPVGATAGWVDPESEEADTTGGIISPYDQSGSRVFFCAEPSAKERVLVMRYYARVVTPGTYAWEPASVGSSTQDGRASLTKASTIVLR